MEKSNSEVTTSHTRSLSAHKAKFKFCYIIRGLPGTGKSTVAKQLAGEHGVILKFEPNLSKFITNKSEGENTTEEKNYQEFCKHIQQGVEIIVIDGVNIRE